VLAAGVVEPVRLLGVAFHALSAHAQLALDLDAHLFDAPRRAVVAEHDHVSGRLAAVDAPEVDAPTGVADPPGAGDAPEAGGTSDVGPADDRPTGADVADSALADTLVHTTTGTTDDDGGTDPVADPDLPDVTALDAAEAADAGSATAVVGRPLGPSSVGRPLDEANARPGLDVEHATLGRGWVVHVRGREATVRFETATTAPARSRVLDLDADPLVLVEPVGVTPPSAVPAELRPA
jgi:DNA polymerase-4